MAGLKWYGAQWKGDFKAEWRRRTSAACILLSSRVKADISQPGTLRYHPKTKSGKASKSRKTVYNFTHSAPGNPPFKQKGRLRGSIAWEIVQGAAGGIVGRVGTNLKVGRYLELGTRRMKARPFLRPNLRNASYAIKLILTKQFPKGGVPAFKSNQSRSGILGRGAKKAGY
jgi:hypothetical protein